MKIPVEFGQVGTPLPSILQHIAARGDLGDGPVDKIVNDRIDLIVVQQAPYQEHMASTEITLDVQSHLDA